MRKLFRPLPDITAYEAAYLLGRISGNGFVAAWNGVTFTQEQWADEVPQEMQRHFEDDKQ